MQLTKDEQIELLGIVGRTSGPRSRSKLMAKLADGLSYSELREADEIYNSVTFSKFPDGMISFTEMFYAEYR